jgi:hypothetical protein
MEDELKKYYDIYDDTPGTLQVRWEWACWLHKLDTEIKPKTYVEIGNEYGGSLATINKLLPETRLIGIDLKPAHEGVSNPVNPPDKYEHHYEFIKGDSHDVNTWKELMMRLGGKRADVIFIDGSHRFEDVYQDWTDYARLAKVVAFHDICWSAYAERGGFFVHFLWNYLNKQYRGEEIIAPRGTEDSNGKWGGIGVLHLVDKLGYFPLPMDFQNNERNN